MCAVASPTPPRAARRSGVGGAGTSAGTPHSKVPLSFPRTPALAAPPPPLPPLAFAPGLARPCPPAVPQWGRDRRGALEAPHKPQPRRPPQARRSPPAATTPTRGARAAAATPRRPRAPEHKPPLCERPTSAPGAEPALGRCDKKRSRRPRAPPLRASHRLWPVAYPMLHDTMFVCYRPQGPAQAPCIGAERGVQVGASSTMQAGDTSASVAPGRMAGASAQLAPSSGSDSQTAPIGPKWEARRGWGGARRLAPSEAQGAGARALEPQAAPAPRIPHSAKSQASPQPARSTPAANAA